MLKYILAVMFAQVVTTTHRLSLEDEIRHFLKEKNMGISLGIHGEPEFELVTPIRTNYQGRRQSENSDVHDHQVFYTINAFGQQFLLKLEKTYNLTDTNLLYTARNDDGTVTVLDIDGLQHCLYHGISTSHNESTAALSTCDGLAGIIRTLDGDFIIEALPYHLRQKQEEIQHVMYKKSTHSQKTCATRRQISTTFLDYTTAKLKSRSAEYASKLTIETAVFLDYELYIYFKDIYEGNADYQILRYALAIMNAIQLMYNDPSLLKVPVNFVLIKVEIFKTRKPGFLLTKDADSTLGQFCAWQYEINEDDDDDDEHWDHAFLFSGYDLVSDGSSAVIGIAPMNGMCKGSISCTLTEAKGFIGVYTGAHEAGHNFGMDHDGDGNRCDEHRYIMAPMDEPGQVTWSSCSRKYMKEYLKDPWTGCLLDERRPSKDYNHYGDYPGIRYSLTKQCELTLGEGAVHNKKQPLSNICYSLSCIRNRKIVNIHPALEGTECGDEMSCKSGHCVETN